MVLVVDGVVEDGVGSNEPQNRLTYVVESRHIYYTSFSYQKQAIWEAFMRKLDWDKIKSITDFAFFYDFYASLDELEKMAADENWKFENMEGRRNQNNPILENYLHHTFKRLRDEYIESDDTTKNEIFYIDENIACFNVGLYTKNYNVIYAVFKPAQKESYRKPFSFYSFEQQASRKLEG